MKLMSTDTCKYKTIAEANAQALIEKQRRAQEIKDEDAAIAEHQRKKDAEQFEA